MSRFRKKPIEVEAYQLTTVKEIQTREGNLYGYPGDWIITGIQGEIYPCGKEIFEATYEPVGCASHSSAPQLGIAELDAQIRVLEELKGIVDDAISKLYTGTEDVISSHARHKAFAWVNMKIEELRQEGKQEQP